MVGVDAYTWAQRWHASGRVPWAAAPMLFTIAAVAAPDGGLKIEAAAAWAGVSRRTIERGIRKLEAAGALSREKRRGRYVVMNLRHP